MPGAHSYAIGIMSGTSVDGIDVAMIALHHSGSAELVATHSADFPAPLRQQILDLMLPGDSEIDRAGSVHKQLGMLYASAVNTLLQQPDSPDRQQIAVIGCHGQTVRHRPDQQWPFTLQLGCGATIAQQTGITTVTDFRSADMAAGGQGAPFAPFFHHALFASTGCNRAIVNLGGIANITILRGDDIDTVTGFDSGPANGLMDAWIQQQLGKQFDRNGAWARSGKLDTDLLHTLLAEPYLDRPAPKSTGRELFNIDWLESKLSTVDHSISPQDVQHTLGCFTAQTVAAGLPDNIDEVYLCGGGAMNSWLIEQLTAAIGKPVDDTEALGIASQWIESAAFAWMANETLHGRASSIPSVTGASRPVVTGAVYFPGKST